MTTPDRLDFVALWEDRSGAAAAEMALAIPMLLILLFGSIEVGNYFASAHNVQKGVRDAARYAARVPYSELSTGSCTYDTAGAAHTEIRNVARTGTPDGTREPRLNFWTDNTTVSIAMTCDTSGTYQGSFEDNVEGAPRITVTARVPYQSLFGLPYIPNSLTVNAANQAPVFGG